jgi:hypothetical protein
LVFSQRSLRSGDLLEVRASHEVRDIIVIGSGFWLGSTLEQALDLLVLLRANLLQDLRDHVLELLRLWVSGRTEELLSHGELDYRQRVMP